MAKKKRATASAGPAIWAPQCVQVEHTHGHKPELRLSRTGKGFPNSVFFLYQIAPPPHITLPCGVFLGYPQTPTGATTFDLPVDADGLTQILTLDRNAPKGDLDWKPLMSTRPKIHSGGGIIIDA
jgi:hypothetical protein